MNNVVTCVYCGHQYPEGTPTHQAELLTEHIKSCEYHPLRKSEERVKKTSRSFRRSSWRAFFQMRLVVRRLGLEEKERDVLLDEIDVLIELIEEELKEGKL